MAYRNPLGWNRNLRPGLFKSDPNALLPEAEQYVEEEVSQLDIDLRLAKDFEEIDRMNAEMDALYVQSELPPIGRKMISYGDSHLITVQDPRRRWEIENAH